MEVGETKERGGEGRRGKERKGEKRLDRKGWKGARVGRIWTEEEGDSERRVG